MQFTNSITHDLRNSKNLYLKVQSPSIPPNSEVDLLIFSFSHSQLHPVCPELLMTTFLRGEGASVAMVAMETARLSLRDHYASVSNSG